MDDEGSARRATRHLIDVGHKRIGFIAGSPEYSLSRWRIDGWTAEMATAGLATGGLLVEGDFTFASGAAAARQLLDRANPPTAIIANRSEEHTSELQSLMRISYAVFCLKKKTQTLESSHNNVSETYTTKTQQHRFIT